MSRARWHIVEEGASLVLSRRRPVRFDLAAETLLPAAPRRAIADQVRQDMWRRLRDLPGFLPAVAVTSHADGLHIRAGGEVARHPFPKAQAEAAIADMLCSPVHRGRWLAHARRRACHG